MSGDFPKSDVIRLLQLVNMVPGTVWRYCGPKQTYTELFSLTGWGRQGGRGVTNQVPAKAVLLAVDDGLVYFVGAATVNIVSSRPMRMHAVDFLSLYRRTSGMVPEPKLASTVSKMELSDFDSHGPGPGLAEIADWHEPVSTF